MDAPPSLTAPPRMSALPRPQSKLPTPRPTSTLITGIPIPESRLPQLPQLSQRQSGTKAAPSSYRSTISGPASRSSLARPSSVDTPLQIPQRQPLGLSSRPQSRHDSAVDQDSFERHVAAAHLKAARHPSQQENTLDLADSPAESDASTDRSHSKPASPVQSRKRQPRPSLSDRTVESLSSIPPSPAASRRQSELFGVKSPTATPRPSSRPPSALGYATMPRLNSNAGRTNGSMRPPSPVKRPGLGGPPTTPARRTLSSGLPKSAVTSSTTNALHKRVESTPTATPRPTSAIPSGKMTAKAGELSKLANPRQRPMSMMGPPPRASTLGTPRQAAKPVIGAAKVRRPIPTPATPGDATSRPNLDVLEDQRSKSSADFRAQIAKAKASHRTATTRQSGVISAACDYEQCEDPFNQTRPAKSTLAKRIDGARRDGRLNIAALELKQIPDEVLTMYDAEAMEASSVTWSETVDLIRFNAADNLIESIPTDVFPDASPEELATGQNAKGSQFGGLEGLDLHGNLLRSVPMGLRRLERLTSLRLSRNKLDNSIFDVLQYMTSLRELRLSDNDLTREVPDSIGQLGDLEVLELQNNKLSILPGSIRNLVNLRVINVSSNRFTELPIGSLFSLPVLREVHVASNALTGAFFPMTVDIVRSLHTLDVSNNSLASISFGSELHLPSLQYLNISRNRLFALPNVSSWQSLVTLLVEENALTALPDGFPSLRKLKTADFQRNSLRTIEPDVAKMDALEDLSVAANPLREKRLLTLSTTAIKEELAKKAAAAG